jgi:hypothetical protein
VKPPVPTTGDLLEGAPALGDDLGGRVHLAGIDVENLADGHRPAQRSDDDVTGPSDLV